MVEYESLPSLENHGTRPHYINASSRLPSVFYRTIGGAVVGAAL
jgi:hypothetical protein